MRTLATLISLCAVLYLALRLRPARPAVVRGMERGAALARYRTWLAHQMRLENSPARAEIWRLVELARTGDVTLLCWCAPLPCHGDVVKQVVEDCIRRMEA